MRRASCRDSLWTVVTTAILGPTSSRFRLRRRKAAPAQDQGPCPGWADAPEAYDRAIKTFGNAGDNRAAADIWANRSVVLWHLQRYPEALASTDRAIDINPDSFQAWYNRGIVLMALGRNQEALTAYDRAVGINPKDANVLAAKGLALVQVKRLQEAIATFEQALKLDPNNAIAQAYRDTAVQQLQQLEEKKPSDLPKPKKD